MGGCTFYTTARGKTAREAFNTAVEEAEHGHGAYTGTIASKPGFVVIARDARVSARDQAIALINAEDPRIDDKWGPAGALDLGGGEWMFFGWASS